VGRCGDVKTPLRWNAVRIRSQHVKILPAMMTPRRGPESSGARRIGVTQLARAASMRIQLRRQRPSLLTQARCRAARRCATPSWRLPALGRPMSEE
jgi:hypothetical protein